MRFLIINTDYEEFLDSLYRQYPGLEKESYAQQLKARNDSFFGVADFYSSNLRKLGHEAWDIHVNNEFMQKAWAREHGLRLGPDKHWHFRLRRGIVPWFSRVKSREWLFDILAAQIKYYKPDILLNEDMHTVQSSFLQRMKPDVRLLVGQIAAPLPDGENFKSYDLIVSSLPNFIEYFRKSGVKAQLNRFAFEPRVLDYLKETSEKILVSFVGSISRYHESRIKLLEYLCSKFDIQIWGQGVKGLPQDSLIRRNFRGMAYGVDMYRILYNSRITLNQHIEISQNYANNMRLFEATGAGTLLITDWKANLQDIFEPHREVVAYRSPEECEELIRYYLEHYGQRQAIAQAGQRRTLAQHTYYNRMRELVEIVADLI
jgi:hypothetical protein